MLAEKIASGEPIVGTMLRLLHHPAAIEVLAHSGFDFVMLDLEHGTYDLSDVARLAVPARLAGLGFMVRVPELARGYVSKAYDLGVDGVMVPMIETPEQARQFVQWAKYPPLGGRGLTTAAGHTGYHNHPNAVAMMAEANRTTLAIAQVETALAVEHADAIASTPGIDALLVGPNDLSVSLGKPGQVECPEENEAIATFADAASRQGRRFGMHAGTGLLRRWCGHGMSIVMNDLDVNQLLHAYVALNQETRDLLQPAE